MVVVLVLWLVVIVMFNCDGIVMCIGIVIVSGMDIVSVSVMAIVIV